MPRGNLLEQGKSMKIIHSEPGAGIKPTISESTELPAEESAPLSKVEGCPFSFNHLSIQYGYEESVFWDGSLV